MSNNQLEPLEGTIVDERPFTDAAEAQQFMTHAMSLLRDGAEMQNEAQRLLNIGAAREIWKPLGYESWEECLTARFSETFTISMTKAARSPLVVTLRRQGLSTAHIARAVGTSAPTINRELQALRANGELSDEPDRVVGDDGRSRPTSLAKTAPRRLPLDKSWRTAVDGMNARTTSLRNLVQDDRYRSWLPQLVNTRSDLQRTHELLGQILADFDTVSPQEN